MKILPQEYDSTLVYTTNASTKLTLLRAISEEGRARFNRWWRLNLLHKSDRTLPAWWDAAAKAVAIPKVEDRNRLFALLKKTGFGCVEVPESGFIMRLYDVEDEYTPED